MLRRKLFLDSKVSFKISNTINKLIINEFMKCNINFDLLNLSNEIAFNFDYNYNF